MKQKYISVKKTNLYMDIIFSFTNVQPLKEVFHISEFTWVEK